jgi:hypothetical protein
MTRPCVPTAIRIVLPTSAHWRELADRRLIWRIARRGLRGALAVIARVEAPLRISVPGQSVSVMAPSRASWATAARRQFVWTAQRP